MWGAVSCIRLVSEVFPAPLGLQSFHALETPRHMMLPFGRVQARRYHLAGIHFTAWGSTPS